MVPLGEQEMREVFDFHSKLVLRHLRASSLPMRLWGWEQTEDLIALSYKHRWDAKAYLVRNRRRGSADGCIFYVILTWLGLALAVALIGLSWLGLAWLCFSLHTSKRMANKRTGLARPKTKTVPYCSAKVKL